MMRRAAAAIGGISALLCAGVAHAAAAEPTLAPSPALECLTPSAEERARLAYPEESFKRKEGGTVPVELRFTGPDTAPDVKLLGEGGFDELKQAVRKHVRQFRVPCMKAGDRPVVLRQDYVFMPNDGRKVVSSTPSDVADEARRAQMRCLVQTGRDKIPEYPQVSLRSEQQGNVLVRMHFASPEQPPQVQVLAAPKHRYLRESVETFVQGYRLPCLHDSQVSMDILFRFLIQGGARTVLKDMSLRTFVLAAKDPPRPAYFDLHSMECPFDLRITYQRPHVPNTVGELERSIPARKPLLDWLSQITLNLPEARQNDVLGDQFVLSVPCGKIDL